MKKCGMNPSILGSNSQDHSAWRSLCIEAVTQFEEERVTVFSINAQSISKRHNHWATSAPGLVIIVRGSALPESDCTLTNSLNNDKDNRSVDFDGAVHVHVRVCVCLCVVDRQIHKVTDTNGHPSHASANNRQITAPTFAVARNVTVQALTYCT